MAAIRHSGMEISDLTLEFSDLSQEILEGVNKSAQAVQAAENGIRHIDCLIDSGASIPTSHQFAASCLRGCREFPCCRLCYKNIYETVEFSSDDEADSVEKRDT